MLCLCIWNCLTGSISLSINLAFKIIFFACHENWKLSEEGTIILNLWYFQSLYPSLVDLMCPADQTLPFFCTLSIPFGSWTLCFHSEYLLRVVFLWTGATPCCFPSTCLSCLYGKTAWCHDLLCVSYYTFLCFSVWRVCSIFFFNLNSGIYVAVLYSMLLCFSVSAQVWAEDDLFSFR